MTVINILIFLLILGLGLYIVQRLPIESTIKSIIVAVAVVLAAIYVLKHLAVFV